MSAIDPLAALKMALVEAGKPSGSSTYRLGEVTGVTGGVQVRLDGESTTSEKAYPRLQSYTPAIADRVLLAQVGSTWVVMGAVIV